MTVNFVYSVVIILLLSSTAKKKQTNLEELVKKVSTQAKAYSKYKKIDKIDLDDKELILIYKDKTRLPVDLSKINMRNVYRKGKASIGFECNDGYRCFPNYEVDDSMGSSIILEATIYVDFDSYAHATLIKENLVKIQKIVTE